MSDYDNSALSGAKRLNIAALETARLADQEAFLANGRAADLEEEAEEANERAHKASLAASDKRKQINDLTAEKEILEDLLEQRNAALGKVMDAVKDAVFEKMSWMLTATKLGVEQGKSPDDVVETNIAAKSLLKKISRKRLIKK